MDSVRMHPPKAKGISFIIDQEAKEISERISNEGGGEQNQSSLSPPSLGRGLLYLLLEEGAFGADFHLEFSRDSVERNRVTTRTPHGDRGRAVTSDIIEGVIAPCSWVYIFTESLG